MVRNTTAGPDVTARNISVSAASIRRRSASTSTSATATASGAGSRRGQHRDVLAAGRARLLVDDGGAPGRLDRRRPPADAASGGVGSAPAKSGPRHVDSSAVNVGQLLRTARSHPRCQSKEGAGVLRDHGPGWSLSPAEGEGGNGTMLDDDNAGRREPTRNRDRAQAVQPTRPETCGMLDEDNARRRESTKTRRASSRRSRIKPTQPHRADAPASSRCSEIRRGSARAAPAAPAKKHPRGASPRSSRPKPTPWCGPAHRKHARAQAKTSADAGAPETSRCAEPA